MSVKPATRIHSEQTKPDKPRLKSLDALRGFDMFWIIGGEGLFAAMFALTGWAGWQLAAGQMQHSQWHGFTLYDLIFPLFIFLSGVALGLSPKRLDKLPYHLRMPLYRHALKRLALLISLGVLYNHGWGAGIPTDPEQIRFSSVLARIGFAWFLAAILVWHTSLRTQIFTAVGILVFYSLLLCFMPFPGGQAGVFTMDGSINAYVDGLLRPGIAYQHRALDPEGVLSTLPAVVNALVGVFVGQFIVRPHDKGDWAKVGIMALSGSVLLALGWLLNPLIPVNKDLWTPSFVLVTSGWSLLFLALFYAIIDVLKWQKWSFVFVVIGTNAIIIYLGSSLIDWQYITRSVFGGVIQAFPSASQPLVGVVGFITVQWLILWWMYRRNIFIRI
ncbi:transmembrane glucosamine N-acetyltransferase NagX [Shewanella sp. HL-SH4]|uniref:transmembrane glucosamine N-acetyltransferase NagX n=1 Tax=Shewanella sp. HL-SH4 TaxID=3436240 RepID=UPI003EBCAE86